MDITPDPTPAQIRHHCLSRFFNVYTAWGYNFVHIPLIDSAHNYERFQGWDLLPHANYSVVDSSGEKAIMRPDMTLFLMHHLPSKKNDTSPQRLWYTDSIVQRSKFKDASPEDILQSGAELIGVPPSTVDFDSEIILLCNHAMEAVGVTHRTTHIGSRELFDHYFQPLLKRSPNHYYALHHTIYERDHVRLPSLIEEVTTVLGYTTKECRQLAALFSYIGAPQKIPNIHIGTPAVQGAARRTLNTLHQTIARLVQCVEGSYTVDLSEIGSHSYHTGVCFRLYIQGANHAAAAGGRYAVEEKGRAPLSAVGFTITLDTVEESLVGATLPSGFTPEPAAAVGDTFAARYHNATQRRAAGQRVHL